ncbi:MAG: hypothetical protein GY851_28155, partial [bacterium]|nr:hypothetical protein [bacterium]
MATERDLLANRIVCRAVFPVIRVLLEDDPATAKRFEGVTATVQIRAKDEAGDVGVCLKFTDGALEIVQEVIDDANVTMGFSSVAKMNAFFGGKVALPSIRGWRNFM